MFFVAVKFQVQLDYSDVSGFTAGSPSRALGVWGHTFVRLPNVCIDLSIHVPAQVSRFVPHIHTHIHRWRMICTDTDGSYSGLSSRFLRCMLTSMKSPCSLDSGGVWMPTYTNTWNATLAILWEQNPFVFNLRFAASAADVGVFILAVCLFNIYIYFFF